jgi:hypothetical protein
MAKMVSSRVVRCVSTVQPDGLAGAKRFQGGIGQPQSFTTLGKSGQRLCTFFDAIDEMVDFGHIGLGVALNEEVQDGVP